MLFRSQSRRDAARDADELQTALHELVWRETPRPRPDPTSASGLWILRGGATTGDALAAALTAAGAQVVRIDTTSDPATWLAAAEPLALPSVLAGVSTAAVSTSAPAGTVPSR